MSLLRRICSLLVLLLAVAVAVSASRCQADILAADTFFSGVLRLDDATGTPLAGGIPGGFPTGSAGLNFAAGVTVGPDRNIYVSSQGSGEILFFDGATGTPLPSPLAGGRDGLFAIMPDNPPAEPEGDPVAGAPSQLRFGPDDSLYVSDLNGTTVRVFDGATGLSLPDAATGIATPGGLAFGPDGALYIGQFSAASIVRVENGVKTDFIPFATSPLQTPAALLFTPNSDLLVVDLYGNQVLRYASSGQFLEQFAVIPPAIPDPVPPGSNSSNNPSDIMFDADGNLLVSVLGITYPPDNRGAILRYDLEGNLLGTVVEMSTPIGSMAWIPSADAVVGDYDGDGTVGESDYEKWKADFGKWVAKGGGADGNGDGIVDAADYTVWRDASPSEAAQAEIGAGASGAVPEPATSALLAAALLAGATGCRGPRRRGRT